MEDRPVRAVVDEKLTLIEAVDFARTQGMTSVDWRGFRIYMSGTLEDLRFSHIRVINADTARRQGGIQ